MYGRARNVFFKMFSDGTNQFDIDMQMNDWAHANPDVEIIDLKFSMCWDTGNQMYATQAIVVYKKGDTV
jgi:hypothetical protein